MSIEAREGETTRIAQWVEPPGPHSSAEMKRASRSPMTVPTRVLAALSLSCFGALILLIFMQDFLASLILFFVGLASGLLAWVVSSLPTRKINDEERAQFALFEPDSAWIVEIFILRDRTVTGLDRGVLWIADGMLNFSGVFCSFAFSKAQIDRSSGVLSQMTGLSGEVTLALRCPDKQELLLSIEPMERDGSRMRKQYLTIGPSPVTQCSLIMDAIKAGLEYLPGQLPPIHDGPKRPSYGDLVGRLVYDQLFNILILGNVVIGLASHFHMPQEVSWFALLGLLIPTQPGRFAAIFGRIRRDRRLKRERRFTAL